MKKLLIMIFLSMSTFADVSIKSFTSNDYGIEYQVDSGVIGVDLEEGQPVFIMGGEKRTNRFDFLFFTGVGFRKTVERTAVVNSSAVSSKGCENGKGNGVKKNCKGNSGENSSPKNGNSSSVLIKDKELFQKVGVRTTLRLFKYVNPSVEFNLATPDMGSSMDTNVQLGFIVRF